MECLNWPLRAHCHWHWMVHRNQTTWCHELVSPHKMLFCLSQVERHTRVFLPKVLHIKCNFGTDRLTDLQNRTKFHCQRVLTLSVDHGTLKPTLTVLPLADPGKKAFPPWLLSGRICLSSLAAGVAAHSCEVINFKNCKQHAL